MVQGLAFCGLLFLFVAACHTYKDYLPKPISDEELKIQIKSIISNLGASGMKDMGRVMGVAMKNLGGKADGSKISSLVKALLS